jgi:hypothetical protein
MSILLLSILGNLIQILCSSLKVLRLDALLQFLGIYHRKIITEGIPRELRDLEVERDLKS